MSTTIAPDLPLTSGQWAIDTTHSAINFSVRHLGLAKVRGRFTDFSGAITVGDSVESTSVHAEIQLASVNTSNPDRDAHLNSGDFFNTETNPVMSFASTGVRADDEGYVLDGDLSIAGVTRPVSLEVELFGVEQYPMDDSTRAGFSATTTVKRSEFGIDFDIPLGADKVAIGDKVTVELDIQVVAP
jgi:polyisoprenoid-binding protein YceI